MAYTKKQWKPKAVKTTDSLTGSFLSKSETEQKRGSLLDPKLLQMVLKTINKRPSMAGEFQQGLAKTATQTWTTHLTQRKKMTKKQKVVEEIASNLGLAKGFRTQFQDEAERLVSILFKEIGKKKPKEEEESTDESSESVEEETDDHSIESIEDIPEPVPKPPPKPQVVKKVVVPKVFPHIIPHTPIKQRRKSVPPEVKEEVKALPTAPKLGLSFINVKEMKVGTSITSKDDKMEQGKAAPRMYVEITKQISEPVIRKTTIPKKERKLSRIKDKPQQKRGLRPSIVEIQSLRKRIDNSLRVRIDPRKLRPSTLWKYLDVKGLDNKSKELEFGSDYMPPKPSRLRSTSWRKASSRRWRETTDQMREKSSTSPRISDRRSRQSRKKMRESGEDQFDEKTKQYVIQQIKEMLNMLTYGKMDSELELIRKRKRQRKSIFVLWKNYFDIRNMESINQEPIVYKKIQREELLKEVDIELVKTGIYGKLASLLGDKSAKSPYEKALWKYLCEKANIENDERERLYDRALEQNISILEEQLQKSRTPEDVIREQERRQKAMEDYMASLIQSSEKYSPKRPNTKETTMEEILIMRGFRGRARNTKNTIWIKRPDFIGYLQPLKRKPKTVYDPSKAKLSKKDTSEVSRVAATKSIESSSRSDSTPYLVSIQRAPLTVEEKKVAILQRPQVIEKRIGPFVEQERGFHKYFGSLDQG